MLGFAVSRVGIQRNLAMTSAVIHRFIGFSTLGSSRTVSSSSIDEADIKKKLIEDITRKLQGPLSDANGKFPQGKDRPVAIEVDGPSHFYVNTTKYTAYTKLKHRLLTRMGYKVLHVPYFEWRKLRGAKERERYMLSKLEEEPTEWLDPDDEAYYSGNSLPPDTL